MALAGRSACRQARSRRQPPSRSPPRASTPQTPASPSSRPPLLRSSRPRVEAVVATEPHAIQRSIIELRVRDAAAGQRLSAEVSAIVRDRLSPLLDRHLTTLSDPDRWDRLDRVEIDLGRLNPARLADDIAAKLEARLPAAL